MTKTTILLDASALKESGCLRRMKHILIDGYKYSSEGEFKMQYGTAFHRALERFAHGDSWDAAKSAAIDYYSKVEVPSDDFRTLSHLVEVLDLYKARYTPDGLVPLLNNNGTPMVEQKFAIPLYVDSVVEILACGTIDFIGHYHGELCFCDHKTTATYYGVEGRGADNYLRGYAMATQLLFYHHVINELAKVAQSLHPLMNIPGMINGIFLSKTKGKEAQFKRSQFFHFTPAVVQAFKEQLTSYCMKLAHAVRTGDWHQEGLINDSCQGKFQRCPYTQLCSRPPEVNERDLVESLYKVKPYNPLTFHEE